MKKKPQYFLNNFFTDAAPYRTCKGYHTTNMLTHKPRQVKEGKHNILAVLYDSKIAVSKGIVIQIKQEFITGESDGSTRVREINYIYACIGCWQEGFIMLTKTDFWRLSKAQYWLFINSTNKLQNVT